MYLLVFVFLFSENSGGYDSTPNPFIFSLANKQGLAPFKSMVTEASRAIYRGPTFGPTFGSGNDIYIADNAASNSASYTRFGHSYTVPSGVYDTNTILAGTHYFTPDDLEVFCLA